MKRLEGKVALITGATGGIGETTARLFLSEGARLLLVGRSAEKLAALAGRLTGEVRTFVAAAADEAAVAGAVDAAVAAFGGLDIVFANAGDEGVIAPVDALDKADFERVLETNVTGAWLALKHGARALRARGGGSMIVTASVAGAVGFAGGAAYVASKHAVVGLVKAAAIDLAAAGIRVNAVAPGPVDNRMIRSIEEQAAPGHEDAVRQALFGKIAMRRYATNDEVARMVLFLASGESGYCTGGVYPVDGGYLAE